MERNPILSALSVQEAEDLLHCCLGTQGVIIPGKHFRDELAKERLDLSDAWIVLRTGHIFKPPEPDIKTGEWKYAVEGYESGGKYLVIIFSFKAVNRAFLITVFSLECLERRQP